MRRREKDAQIAYAQTSRLAFDGASPIDASPLRPGAPHRERHVARSGVVRPGPHSHGPWGSDGYPPQITEATT
jgi:hypothetical protein